jgi:hypothetical protein
VAVLAWQDKRRVTMISSHHRDEMLVSVNIANQEEIKPVVVCDYSLNMLGVDLKLNDTALLAGMK